MQSPNSKQVAQLRRAYKKLWLQAQKMASLLMEIQYRFNLSGDLGDRVKRLGRSPALPRPEELP